MRRGKAGSTPPRKNCRRCIAHNAALVRRRRTHSLGATPVCDHSVCDRPLVSLRALRSRCLLLLADSAVRHFSFLLLPPAMSVLHRFRHAASLSFRCISPRGYALVPSSSLLPGRSQPHVIAGHFASSVPSSSPASPQAVLVASASSEAEPDPAPAAAAFSSADLPATVRHQFRGSPPLPPLGTVDQLDTLSIDGLLRDLDVQVESLRAEHARLVRLSSYLHELAQASVGSQMNRAAIMQHEGLIARAENCANQLHILRQQLEMEPQARSESAIAAACAELEPYHLGDGKFAFDFSVDYSFMQMNAAKMG